jgi:hypothetical protein
MPGSFSYAPHMSQDIAEVVLCHIVVWIERDSPAVVFLGLIETTGLHIKIGGLHEAFQIFARRKGTALILAHEFFPIAGGIRGLTGLTIH